MTIKTFTFIKKINHLLLAVDKENHHYILLNEQELNKCTRDIIFTCGQNFPIYHIRVSAPCKVQIYMNAPGQFQNCEWRHVLSNTTLWIMLTEAQSWVYSTPVSQKVTVQCYDRLEDKIVINGTGKIKLNGNCKLTILDITLTTHAHLPDFNLTLIRDTDNRNMKLSKQAQLQPIIKYPAERTKLSISLEEISENLDNKE